MILKYLEKLKKAINIFIIIIYLSLILQLIPMQIGHTIFVISTIIAIIINIIVSYKKADYKKIVGSIPLIIIYILAILSVIY